MEKIHTDPMIGIILLEKYVITHLLSENGTYGKIYIVQTANCDNFIAKINEDEAMNFKEHQILSILNANKKCVCFPKIYGGGTFEVSGLPTQSFIILEMLGDHLDHFLLQRQKSFTLKTVC